MLEFDFIEDPGHGWLVIPADFILKNGMEQIASGYDYLVYGHVINSAIGRDHFDPRMLYFCFEEDCQMHNALSTCELVGQPAKRGQRFYCKHWDRNWAAPIQEPEYWDNLRQFWGITEPVVKYELTEDFKVERSL